MITFLHGTLLDVDPDGIVLNVGGVGYRIMLPSKLMITLPPKGAVMEIHTYLNIRDDGASLYGFTTKGDLNLYKKLLTVSGIGPKVALNILGATEQDRFINSILTEEVSYLIKLPGIGKKTAQRLILELKDKLSLPEEMSLAGVAVTELSTPDLEDALQALMGLGYQKQEVLPLLLKGQEEFGNNLSAQELIRFVLKGTAKNRRG